MPNPRLKRLLLGVFLVLAGCDGSGASDGDAAGEGGPPSDGAFPSDGGPRADAAAVPAGACTGAADFPDQASGQAAGEGTESACIGQLNGETLIYASLSGLSQEAFAARFSGALSAFTGLDVAATEEDSTTYRLELSTAEVQLRGRMVWQGGTTRIHLGLRSLPGAMPKAWRALPKDGPTPCHLPQAEIDLCRRQSLLKAACDILPVATDSCRELLDLLTGASCEQGPDCGAFETCQAGICCTFGSLACGMSCYVPSLCMTCRDGVVDDFGALGTGELGHDCKLCSQKYSILGGLHCECTPACEASRCCPKDRFGECVDKQTAHSNCGACGNVCGEDQTCVAGVCKRKTGYHLVGEYNASNGTACPGWAVAEMTDGVEFDLEPDGDLDVHYILTHIVNEATVISNVQVVNAGPDATVTIESEIDVLRAVRGSASFVQSLTSAPSTVDVILDFDALQGACTVNYNAQPPAPDESVPARQLPPNMLLFSFNPDGFTNGQQLVSFSHRDAPGFWRFLITPTE